MVKNRGRRYRRNRSYRRNQGFMEDVRKVLRVGALVATGFLTHKLLTSFACELVMKPIKGALVKAEEEAPETEGVEGIAEQLENWEKPLCGAIIGGAQLWITSKVVRSEEARKSIGAGIVVSWLQSVAMASLRALKQDEWAERLEGTPSTAMELQGFGAQTSIMPEYAPIDGMGEYFSEQQTSGLGEYFAANGMGEYFAESGVQGVGNYEHAGPLALGPSIQQAAAGQIDDGIRPDQAEAALMLTEAAAGFGQPPPAHAYREGSLGQYEQAAAGIGMGQGFEQAAAGLGAVARVGTSDTWIPGMSNPQLWAGTKSVHDTQAKSEIAAGILEGPGGSGILS